LPITASTSSSDERGVLSLRPTLLVALIAPCSSVLIASIFSRRPGSDQASLFAIRRGVLSSTSAITRRLLARSDDPVSVTSTIASMIRALTSVAPQLNSTRTSMPRAAKNSRVVRTSSVAITPPSSCSSSRTLDSAGTASTQRAGRLVALL